MGFNVASPWLLPLLLLLPVYIWLLYRYTTRLTGVRKHTAIVLRSIILLLIIVLLAGITPYSSEKQRNVIALVDRSDSARSSNEALQFLQQVSSEDKQDHLAIFSFGRNVVIDRALQPLLGQQMPQSFHTIVDPTQSDIAAALRQAGGLLHQSGGGKIVLLTDGQETTGSMLKEVQLLQAMNVSVDVVPLSSRVGKDAAISRLQVPGQLKQGEKYQLAVTVESTGQAEAELYLYEDEALLAQHHVSLVQGSNTYVIDAIASSPGLKQYRAVIQMPDDTEAKNNSAYALSRVDGPAGVLIVEGEKGSSHNIEAALAASFIPYETILPEQLSYELAQYVQYDSIVFNNVSAVKLPQLKMEHIESSVRNYGVGFVMLGGDNSFGLGGYFDTPIESILPVDMQLSGKKQIPDLSLMLVIDHSGSMEGMKMELAKEAAARTVELMRPVDSVGVIAFDTIPKWIVSPTKLDAPNDVIDSIMSIQAAGGTEIYPALLEAYNGFDLDAPGRRHIILLTDGMSSYTPAYSQLLSDLTSNGITLSTVAVGGDSDIQFLANLAEQGAGRFYFTEDETTLPAIFSREATLMSRAYIVDERVLPLEGYAGSWNQLWRNGLPHIGAYIATSAKATSEVALWTPQEDPLLARWQIGAGKSVAFTSDLNGRWSSDWVTWSEFPQVFTEWVKWTYPQFSHSPYDLKLQEQGRLLVTSRADATHSNLAMTVDQDGESTIVPLVPVGEGEYEADIKRLESGIYMTQIGEYRTTEDGAVVQDGVTTGFVVPYSDEYRLDRQPEKVSEQLAALAELTGGKLLEQQETQQLFQFEPITVKQPYDWSRSLLLLLLLLWLIDIANRRLMLPWGHWISRLRTAVGLRMSSTSEQSSPSAAPQQGKASLQRLSARKQRVSQRSRELHSLDDDWSARANEQVSAKARTNANANANGDGNANIDAKAKADERVVSPSHVQGQTNQQAHAQADRAHRRQTDSGDQRSYQSTLKQEAARSAESKETEAATESSKDTMNRLLAAKNRRKR